MTIPTNAERAEPRLTQHDIAVFRRMELTMRSRPYAVSATEAADAIASLLFHVSRLLPEGHEARHASQMVRHG